MAKLSMDTLTLKGVNVVQLVLALAHIFVLLCGLALIFIGVWALLSEEEYYTILHKGDTQGTRIPTSLIVSGFFVVILAAMGLVGTALASTYTGRIVLGMYAVLLFLMILTEVGSSAAAMKYRDDLESKYTDSARRSQISESCHSNWTESEHWSKFQKKHHCCGSTGYNSYNQTALCPHAVNVTNYYESVTIHNVVKPPLEVPPSCCNNASLHNSSLTCTEVRGNVTPANVRYIYQRGCPSAVIDTLRHDQLTIFVASFLLAVVQFVGIVSALVVIGMKLREESASEKKYTRLRHIGLSTTVSVGNDVHVN